MKKSVMVVLLVALVSSAFAYESMVSTSVGWGGTMERGEIENTGLFSLNHGVDVSLAYHGFFTPTVGFFVRGNLLMYLFGSDIKTYEEYALKNDFSNRFSINAGPSFRVGGFLIDVGLHYGLHRLAGKKGNVTSSLMWSELGFSFGGKSVYPLSKNVGLLLGSDVTLSLIAIGDVVTKNDIDPNTVSKPANSVFNKYVSLGCAVNMGIEIKF